MNKFTVYYPNGIKRHIKKSELDLLGPSVKQIGPHEYRVPSLQADIDHTQGPSYLSGRFIIVHGDKRESEQMETPKGMLNRLKSMGWKPLERSGALA